MTPKTLLKKPTGSFIEQRITLPVFLFCMYGLKVAFLQAQSHEITFQSLKEGISNHQVKCILEDHEGFMWFGTNDGLNKYDGECFTVYENESGNQNTICDNIINAMVEDKQNNLWVGTSNGLCYYNPEKDSFSCLKQLEHEEILAISALYCDNQNRIWIGTYSKGLHMFDPKANQLQTFLHDENAPNCMRPKSINSIVGDKMQNIWIGTSNGLELYNPRTQKFRYFMDHPDIPSSLSNNIIKCLTVDKEDNLWVGTYGGGLIKLKKENGKYYFEHFQKGQEKGSLSHNTILSLCYDHNGNLWAGTENGGLNCLPNGAQQFVAYNNQEGYSSRINSNSIWSLYEDKTGILWIGTYNQGVNLVDDRGLKFRQIRRNNNSVNTLVGNNVKGFAEDNKGMLWIATDGGGLGCFNTRTRCFEKPVDNESLSSKSLMDLIVDKQGNIWVGTWGNGIELMNANGTGIRTYKNQEGIEQGNNVACLYEDKQGNIWSGTFGNGLHMYDPVQDKFVRFTAEGRNANLSSQAFINDILEDSRSTLWVATLYGLVAINRTEGGECSLHKFLHANNDSLSISSNRVTCIFEDRQKNIWIGTEKGLNLMNRKDRTFMPFLKQDGLPNNIIKGILQDENGYLWITTNKGISKFDPQESTFTNFSKQDGLSTNEFNRGACIKTSGGEFFVAGNNGIDAFFPDSIHFNPYVPPVYITGFEILDAPAKGTKGIPSAKEIARKGKIELPYKQNSFQVGFVALNYTRPGKNQYAYKLEGFDEQWHYIGNENSATYTNLNIGKYVFMVRGSNNDGLWNKTPAQLEIVIKPPYWRTFGAYLLYIFLFSLLLYCFVRLLLIREKQAQSLELEKNNREKDEELNRMKIQFITNLSHELRTPLSLIVSPLEQITAGGQVQGNLESRLQLVLRNVKRLSQLVNELMDFTKSEEKRYKMDYRLENIVKFTHDLFYLYTDEADRNHISYEFYAEKAEIEACFDKGKMEKVILNLISNAFKHIPERGIVKVCVRKEEPIKQGDEEQAVISVIDNGPGIAPEHIEKVFERFFQSPGAGTQNGIGVGLAMTKNLVEMHQGSIQVTSKKGKGTCFSVSIPLGAQHIENKLTETEAEEKKSFSPAQDIQSAHGTATAHQVPTVLIIEDNTDLRNYIASELSHEYQVIEAAEGISGYQSVLNHGPDLIISDVIMPGLTGTEVCRQVKENMATSHIPVILLTSKVSVEDKIEGVENGADVYITKPFNVPFLQVSIKKLIETRRTLYQRFSQEAYLLPKELAQNNLDQIFLEKITAYVHENVGIEEITVESLAAYLLMNRSNVYRKIKALTGQTASEFIRTIRLKMAIKHLNTGAYNIAEVAYKVGFSSPGYFAKCFKAQFGKPPSGFLNKKDDAAPRAHQMQNPVF